MELPALGKEDASYICMSPGWKEPLRWTRLAVYVEDERVDTVDLFLGWLWSSNRGIEIEKIDFQESFKLLSKKKFRRNFKALPYEDLMKLKQGDKYNLLAYTYSSTLSCFLGVPDEPSVVCSVPGGYIVAYYEESFADLVREVVSRPFNDFLKILS